MNALREASWNILLQSVARATCSALLPASCVLLLVSSSVDAMIDANNNGVSDLWEKRYNDGQRFTDFESLADPDHDGWTNAQEAAAGTDPFDANPPGGFLSPTITHYPATYSTDPETSVTQVDSPETISIEWPTLPGKQYTLLYSTDLAPSVWQPLEESYEGNGSTVFYYIPLTEEGSTRPDRLFWRVGITDAIPEFDSDVDSLSNYEEYLAGTDPVITDSDTDNLSDYAELIAGTNPNHADEDGDGITDPLELAAGTDSKNQDTDGDAIPDSLDSQPLLSAQVFADADDDGIPDANDPDPNNPRGPKPLIISDNASGNPHCELEIGESSSLILTVSNPAGPAPTSSNFTLYLNGNIEETANITALTTPPSATGTQRFNFSWLAKVTTSYPAQTLQNISLRFRDSQNATTWLNVARADVAEWEGMIAGVSSDGLNFPDYPQVRVASHCKGVKQSTERFLHGGSVWYRGPKAITLLDASGSTTGSTAQIGAERYPLFVISKSGTTYNVEQTLDISDPVAYPHYGRFYVNRWSTDITMSPSAVGSIGIPAGAIRFQPFPPAPETGTPNFGVLGHSFIDGENKTVYTNVWTLTEPNLPFREFRGLVFFNGTTPDGESYQDIDGIGGVNADIGATITAHSTGTLEYPGMPISPPGFPPAPYNNWPSQTPLLPIQSEQWHKLVLKVGPDAGAVSNGITLKLGTGVEGEKDPQSGFTLQTPGTGGFEPLTIPANGKIEMTPTSELYQKLTSIEGLTLFLKRNSTVSEFHRLGLDLIPKHSTYLIQRIAAVDLPPLDLVPDINMAGVIGDVVESAVVGSNIKHFVTPKLTTELAAPYVILKVTGITAEQIDPKSAKQIFEWDGGETVPNEPLKRRVKRDVAQPNMVKIKVKQGGAIAAEFCVWVVWTEVSVTPYQQVQFSPSLTAATYRGNPGAQLSWRFVFTIHPATIISAPERPDLNGTKETAVPGENTAYFADPSVKGDSATLKWDVSRQVENIICNPNLIPKNQFPVYPIFANQPKAMDTVAEFPTNHVEGNDDPIGINDENGNPYQAYIGNGLNHAIGQISSYDGPAFGTPTAPVAAGATFAIVANFREFARSEIGSKTTPQGARTWYKISDYKDWHHVLSANYGQSNVSGLYFWGDSGSSSNEGIFTITPN